MRINNIRRELRIVVIGGVRPQYIKIAALQRAINEFNRLSAIKIEARYINSGQHYDPKLSLDILEELEVGFDFTLSHQSHVPIEMLGRMITEIYRILDELDSPPDWVVVLGDATTTMAGAIAASRKLLPIVHMEAGVRSGKMDTLEEVHRRMVSHISSVHFCYARKDVDNLKAEKIIENVFWTGDLSYDFFMDYAREIPPGFGTLPNGEYILVTLHKPQNLYSQDVLPNLIYALNNHTRPVLFVTHPKCRERLQELDLIKGQNITFVSPLNYRTMLSAIKGSSYVITDSGGIRRESFYLNKLCLVRKDSVGWLEPISSGQSKLLGVNNYEEELVWAENEISQIPESDISAFVRENACNYALKKLVDLAAFHSN
jgi:UDP-GlcNAc3NAcA epimerase